MLRGTVAASLLLAAACASTAKPGSDVGAAEGGVAIPTVTTALLTAGHSTVQVILADSGGQAPMGVTLSPSTVPPGDVTFVVKNAGTIEHEAIVLKTDTPFDKIPIDHAGDPPAKVAKGGNKVGEDTNIGETGDPNLKPGETRTFTIANMSVGSYAVVCNIAGHYKMGMRAAFHVRGVASTVNVTLADASGHGPMGVTLSPASVPPGDVTFIVKNAGTIEHEAIVLKTDTPFDKIPIDHAGDPPARVPSGGDKVGEDANIGETGDPNLKPGETRAFTIDDMAAGPYVVVCNLAGHYGFGMRAKLTVQGPKTTVHVTLGDARGHAPMTLKLTPDNVPAGDVTFVVKNVGTVEHEAIVLKTDTPFDQLPVTYAGDPPAKVASGGNKVGDDANVGETGDPNVKPGETRTFTITAMQAGSYVIVCNLADHYTNGMRAAFTVS